jgi:hypothetical protein
MSVFDFHELLPNAGRNFRNRIIGQFCACPGLPAFLTLYRKLIDMDLTQTIHVPVYRPVKDFNILKTEY